MDSTDTDSLDGEARSESYRAAVSGPSAPAAPMTSDEPNAATKAATPPADGQPKPTLTATETAKAHEQQDRAVQEGKVPDAETLYSLVDDKSAERLKAMGGADTLLATLGSSREHGRDPARTEETQERYGINRLPDLDFKSIWALVYEALKDKTLIMLVVAALISLAVGMATEGPELGWKDGVAVLVAVAVVVAITSGNDYQKERQFRRLNDVKNDRTVTVVRHGGHRERISVYDLLVGDVAFVDTGDIIPADGVFLEGESMRADESSATGESRAINKGIGEKLDPFLLSGTQLIEGNGTMLVIAVGEQSYYGRIMLSLRTPAADTPLQDKLAKFANAIGNFGIVAALVIFFAQLIKYFAIEGQGVDSNDALRNAVDFLVIAISIVVVAVPEGLPLAVTISLAYSMRHMMRDHNLVRHLDACETMGGATTVCSDKTGTLTQNRMTVVAGQLVDRTLTVDENGVMAPKDENGAPGLVIDANGKGDGIANGALHHLFACICVNSTAYRAEAEVAPTDTDTDKEKKKKKNKDKSTPEEDSKASAVSFVGNQTECALLQFAEVCGQDYVQWRQQTESVHVYSFSSDRKRMSTVVKAQPGSNEPNVLYCKGAAEVVLSKCDRILLADNSTVSLDEPAAGSSGESRRAVLEKTLAGMNARALRALCLAYRPCSDDRDWTEEETPALVCIGVVGILDPLRPEIRDAVAKCHSAGVVVRMITGDSLAIAKNIASNCGIYDAEKDGEAGAMEGPDFRKLSEREMRRVLPRLRILARSSPTDKFKLVSALQSMGEVVAVTGDGVNDGPALKKADVGFAMGLSGTDVAKEAADIVLLDDNFASIVNAIKWGRSVFDNIRKFLQFQLVVNFTAILLVFISVLVDSSGDADSTPLKPVQLLWINLIMDSFAALALATEKPNEELLRLKPFDRNEPLITRFMGRRMALQIVLQTITFLTLLYAFAPILDAEKGPGDDPDLQFSVRHLTFIFNAFVLTQLVNQFNSRKLRGELNVFAGLLEHRIFIGVWLFSLVVQVLLVQFAGTAVETEALSGTQWIACGVVALLPLVWAFLFALLPDKITRGRWPWYDYMMLWLVRAACGCCRKIPAEEEEEAAAEGEVSVVVGNDPDAVTGPALVPSVVSVTTPREKTESTATSPLALNSSETSELLVRQEGDEEEESEAAQRWRRALWATMTQVQVVDAFRRKHR